MNPIQYTLQTLVKLDSNGTGAPRNEMAAAKKFLATITDNPMPVEYSSGWKAILEFIYYLFNGTESASLEAINDNAALVLDALQSSSGEWHSICDYKGNKVQIKHSPQAIYFKVGEQDEQKFTVVTRHIVEELRYSIPIRGEFTPETRALTELLDRYKQLVDLDATMEQELDENLLLQHKESEAFARRVLVLLKDIDLNTPILLNNSTVRDKILLLEKIAPLVVDKHQQPLPNSELHQDAAQSDLNTLVALDILKGISTLDKLTGSNAAYDEQQLSKVLDQWLATGKLNEISSELAYPSESLPEDIANQLRLVLGENGLPADLNTEATKQYLTLYLQTRKLNLDIEKNGLTANTFARFNRLQSEIHLRHTEQNQAGSGLSNLLLLCENTVENSVIEIIADAITSVPKGFTIHSTLIRTRMPAWLRQYKQLPALISTSVEDNVQFINGILASKIDKTIRDIVALRSGPDNEPSIFSDELPVNLAEIPITVEEIMASMPRNLPSYDKLDELIVERLQNYQLLQTPPEDDPNLELP